MRLFWIRVILNPLADVLNKKRRQRYRHRAEGSGQREAETAVRQLQGSEGQRLLPPGEARKGKGKHLPASFGGTALPTP